MMMKKNGFTLAEVLITLTIIGVVAVLTLPSLLTNTQDAQAKTALKKIVNTITEVGQTSSAQENYDYTNATAGLSSVVSGNPTDTDFSTNAMFQRHAALKNANDSGCIATFADGTCVVSWSGTGTPISVTVDTNGGKAPNREMVTDANGRPTTHGDRFRLNIIDGKQVQAPANTLADATYWALRN